MSYFIVAQCPKCGIIEVHEIRTEVIKYTYKCFNCRATRRIKSSKVQGYNINIFYHGSDARIAQKICMDLKQK